MERIQCRVVSVAGEHALAADNDEARSVLGKLEIDERVGTEVYRERYNKFSTFVHMVFERIGRSTGCSVKNVRGWIAAESGRADVVTIGGAPVLVAWGTGPRDMSASEFEAFWDDAREIIRDKIVPTLLDPNDRSEIVGMLHRHDHD